MDQQTCSRCGENTADRYCPQCGLDQRPGTPVNSENHQRLALDRERHWLEQHPDSATSKTCPDCAEQVQGAAKVCRYCGYRFDGAYAPPRPPTVDRATPAAASAASVPRQRSASEQKSAGGAAVLSFLIAGLGHMYLREFGRGILIFLSAVMVGVGVALLGATAAILSLPVLILSARDAWMGANAYNDGAEPRQVSGLLWGTAGVALTVLIIGVVAYSDGGGAGGVNADDVEAEIQPELERQLQDQVLDATVSVESVDCVSSGDGGTCIAEVSDDIGNNTSMGLSYTVDGSTGEFVWRTD